MIGKNRVKLAHFSHQAPEGQKILPHFGRHHHAKHYITRSIPRNQFAKEERAKGFDACESRVTKAIERKAMFM